MPSLLIVEDEPVLAQNLVKAFAGQGFDVEVAGRIADAKRLVASRLPDVALLDLRLPDGSGLDLLAVLVREDPELPRSEEHTSELQSPCNLVCRLLLEKKKKKQ